MSSLRNQCITMAIGAGLVGGVAAAGATEVPTGNLFYQNGAATAPKLRAVYTHG